MDRWRDLQTNPPSLADEFISSTDEIVSRVRFRT